MTTVTTMTQFQAALLLGTCVFQVLTAEIIIERPEIPDDEGSSEDRLIPDGSNKRHSIDEYNTLIAEKPLETRSNKGTVDKKIIQNVKAAKATTTAMPAKIKTAKKAAKQPPTTKPSRPKPPVSKPDPLLDSLKAIERLHMKIAASNLVLQKMWTINERDIDELQNAIDAIQVGLIEDKKAEGQLQVNFNQVTSESKKQIATVNALEEEIMKVPRQLKRLQSFTNILVDTGKSRWLELNATKDRLKLLNVQFETCPLIRKCAERGPYTNEGNLFAISFPPTMTESNRELIIVSRKATRITVRSNIDQLDVTLEVPAMTSVFYKLNADHVVTASGLFESVVYVSVTAPLSLFAYESLDYYYRSILINPVEFVSKLGNRYYYVHGLGDNSSFGEKQTKSHGFTISAPSNNTIVRIFEKKTGGYRLIYDLCVNSGKSVIIADMTYQDFTGWKVESSKPIVVISRSSNKVLIKDSFEIYPLLSRAIGSSIISTERLGKEYLVPGIETVNHQTVQDEVLIRVLSVTNNNAVRYNKGPTSLLHEGEFHDYRQVAMSIPSLVTCTERCSVALYTHQKLKDRPRTGSIQFQLIPLGGFSNDFLFSTPNPLAEHGVRYFISIVVAGNNTKHIYLDGTPVNSNSWRFVEGESSIYKNTIISVNFGAHRLHTNDSDTRMAGYLYANAEAFYHFIGYPVGFSYNAVADDDDDVSKTIANDRCLKESTNLTIASSKVASGR